MTFDLFAPVHVRWLEANGWTIYGMLLHSPRNLPPAKVRVGPPPSYRAPDIVDAIAAWAKRDVTPSLVDHENGLATYLCCDVTVERDFWQPCVVCGKCEECCRC